MASNEMSSRTGGKPNFLNNDFYQVLEALQAPLSTQEAKILKETNTVLDNYTLTSDASVARTIQYYVFRLWNSVKALFNQSAWQCVQKDLMNVCVTRICGSKILDLTENDMCLLAETVEAIIDVWFKIKLDSFLDKWDKQEDHVFLNYVWADLYGIKGYLLDCAKKFRIDPKYVEAHFIWKPHLPTDPDIQMPKIKSEALKALGMHLLQEKKVKDLSQLINDVAEVANGVNERLDDLGFIQTTTSNAIRKAIDLQIKVLHCFAAKPFVHKFIELGKDLLST